MLCIYYPICFSQQHWPGKKVRMSGGKSVAQGQMVASDRARSHIHILWSQSLVSVLEKHYDSPLGSNSCIEWVGGGLFYSVMLWCYEFAPCAWVPPYIHFPFYLLRFLLPFFLAESSGPPGSQCFSNWAMLQPWQGKQWGHLQVAVSLSVVGKGEQKAGSTAASALLAPHPTHLCSPISPPALMGGDGRIA